MRSTIKEIKVLFKRDANDVDYLTGVVVAEFRDSVTIRYNGYYYTKPMDEVLDIEEEETQKYSEEIKVCLEAFELIIALTAKKDSINIGQIREVLADTRLKLLGKDDFITKS